MAFSNGLFQTLTHQGLHDLKHTAKCRLIIPEELVCLAQPIPGHFPFQRPEDVQN